MRVVLTGASGFAGHWLTQELAANGHETVALPPDLDVRDAVAIRAGLQESQADAVAHLAAVAYAPDATADPVAAFAVAIAGTINVLEAAREQSPPPALLVIGSSEVYGAPAAQDLPLTEASPLRPATPYALSKAAQEAVVLAYAARYRLNAVVARSFNHAGPGQRQEFVVPALAGRVLELARGRATDIPVGNIDVKRDLSDVRDVVRAYRHLLEGAAEGKLGAGGLAVNVCSGKSVALREVAEDLCRLAGVQPKFRTDPAHVRSHDAPEIRGDHALLTRLTGWKPVWTLDRTLASIWAAMTDAEPAAAASPTAS
jgi:GDP-4-dehydro-6-deoxy-D-mannose reductase